MGRELREIYTAPTLDAAQARFDEFADTWRDRYPAMIRVWEQSWVEFVPFLEFPAELRTLVYTTNAIESATPGSGALSGTGATSPTSKRR